MQRVQMRMRVASPSISTRSFWMFALNLRSV
jgi:hypothetical protein